jgi:hypothetical protein
MQRTIRNRKSGEWMSLASGLAEALVTQTVARMCAFKQTHPMSGGVGRVLADHVDHYRQMRIERFGFDMLPLPLSLAAPESNLSGNRMDLNAVPQTATA